MTSDPSAGRATRTRLPAGARVRHPMQVRMGRRVGAGRLRLGLRA